MSKITFHHTMLYFRLLTGIILLSGATLFSSSCIVHDNTKASFPTPSQATYLYISCICDEINKRVRTKGNLPQTEQEIARILLANPYFLGPIPQDNLKEGIGCYDSWRNVIRYKYLGKQKEGREFFMIYSYGPNGKDENGKGDDISQTYQVQINESNRQ